MAYEIKPLNVSEILDQAVQLVRTRFLTLMAIALILYVPIDLWRGLLVISNLEKIGSINSHMTPREMTQWFLSRGRSSTPLQHVVTWLTILIFTPLCSAAMAHAVSTEYLNIPASVKDSILTGLRKLPSILWTNLILILVLFGVGIASALIIGVVAAVAGPVSVILVVIVVILVFYLLLRLSLLTTTIVIESESGLSAFERSSQLMTGHFSQALVLGLILALMRMIVATFGLLDLLIPLPMVRVVAQSLVDGILMCYASTVFVIFYYSCRCQLDHFDLTTLAESVKEPRTK